MDDTFNPDPDEVTGGRNNPFAPKGNSANKLEESTRKAMGSNAPDLFSGLLTPTNKKGFQSVLSQKPPKEQVELFYRTMIHLGYFLPNGQPDVKRVQSELGKWKHYGKSLDPATINSKELSDLIGKMIFTLKKEPEREDPRVKLLPKLVNLDFPYDDEFGLTL